MSTSIGMREMLPNLATLVNGLTVTSQANGAGTTVALSTTRILGSNDPTFGTVGWAPPLDGRPFCVVKAEGVSNMEPEPNRTWGVYNVGFCIAIEHADTPAVKENYNDLALAWMDAMQYLVAAHRSGSPYAYTLWPTGGDFQWLYKGASIQPRYRLFGIDYYAVEVHTTCRIVLTTTFG